jgi:hypothetical protein
MNKSGEKVCKAQLKDIGTCLKDFQAGALTTTFDACTTNDRKDKVQKARNNSVTAEQNKCLPLAAPPPFGYAGSSTVNAAAVDGALALPRDLFGAPVDDANLATKEIDPDAARCQKGVLKRGDKLGSGILKEINKVKKASIRKVEIDDASALEGALAGVFLSNSKVSKLEDRLAHAVEKKCAPLPAGPAAVFPGICSQPSWSELASCVIAAARCRVCVQVNAFDALSLSCDELDDGASNLSCPPTAP